MNRTHRAVRASFYLALALPFAALACGQSFTAGPGDGGEESGIVFGDGGEDHDATSSTDGSRDAGGDGTVRDGKADTGMPTCPQGSIACSDGGCAQEGPTNCGTCGNDCTLLPHVMNAQCTSGQCSVTCAPGWQNCTTNPNAGCGTDITKQGNCGACNVTCSGNTPVCGGTGCVSGCDAGQTICSGSCVDTTTDPQNCNGCGMPCPSTGPTNSQPSCTNSTCGWTCDTNFQQCTLSSGTYCISAVPDTTHGLFVAPPPAGQPSSCGSASAPCDTVSAALPYLLNGRNIIYVAEGTYTDQVALPAGVTVQGNWLYMGSGQWTRDCALPKTIIQAPAGSNRVVTVTYPSGSSTLDSLALTNATTAGTGVSQYGIFASSSGATAGALVLTNVSINVAAGGSGATGAQGGDGGPPAASCTAGGTLQNGTPGGLGTGAPVGGYGASGYSPSTGAVGTGGGIGSNGTAAPTCGQSGGPDCVGAYKLVNNNYTDNSACCIQNGGTGTTCVSCTGTSMQVSGGTGTPGCGSTGSGPGAPGTGGGASIGLFVWNETVTVNGSGITTTGGGPGGNGGPGGPVYAGSAGAPGAPSPQLVSSSCSQQSIGGNPACVASYKPLDGGSPGGPGFSGGIGGQGGGGAGGDSYCWYAGTGATVTADSFTSANCQHGPGGPGGNQGGGQSQGTSGTSLPSH